MKVKVDINVQTILKRRGLGADDNARIFIASEVGRLCDPYVPMQQGTLKDTRVIANDGRKLIYPQPYAHYHYRGEVMAGRAPKHYTGKSLEHHGAPMRGPEWDKRMKADRIDDLVQSVANYVGGKPK